MDHQNLLADLTRIPYRLYTEPEVYERERRALFMGRTWNYLALDVEIPDAGDYKTTFVGDVPVVVVRDEDGSVNAFINRCAHRGATLCLERFGNAKRFVCAYHAWSYDRKGNLASVAFEKGINGKGGMPEDFDRSEHGLRRLETERFCGMVFGTFARDAPAVETYLGDDISSRVRRVMDRPVEILGYQTQVMHNNWKLYTENVKDPYHASILHLFFTTFRINRLSQTGGIIVDDSGGHHVSYSKIDRSTEAAPDEQYAAQKLRANDERFGLADPSILETRDEFGDGISLQILTMFPNFVIQQIQNALAVRQVLPKAPGLTEVVWTQFGYADDDAELRELRLKQSNFVGPAGYISMEDGAVGGFIQRALPGAHDEASVVRMGGDDVGSQPGRATETSVRGFWQAYRDRVFG